MRKTIHRIKTNLRVGLEKPKPIAFRKMRTTATTITNAIKRL
jgi:hypothetical protein